MPTDDANSPHDRLRPIRPDGDHAGGQKGTSKIYMTAIILDVPFFSDWPACFIDPVHLRRFFHCGEKRLRSTSIITTAEGMPPGSSSDMTIAVVTKPGFRTRKSAPAQRKKEPTIGNTLTCVRFVRFPPRHRWIGKRRKQRYTFRIATSVPRLQDTSPNISSIFSFNVMSQSTSAYQPACRPRLPRSDFDDRITA